MPPALRSNNKSGFTGVSWHELGRKWVAHITVNRRKLHLGLFTSPEDAAAAYEEAVRKYFGEPTRNVRGPKETGPLLFKERNMVVPGKPGEMAVVFYRGRQGVWGDTYRVIAWRVPPKGAPTPVLPYDYERDKNLLFVVVENGEGRWWSEDEGHFTSLIEAQKAAEKCAKEWEIREFRGRTGFSYSEKPYSEKPNLEKPKQNVNLEELGLLSDSDAAQ